MKINQIISEMTASGAIAPVAHSFTKMETRNPSIYGDQKVGNLLKGKKTNKKFANSISEGTEERKRNRQMAQATDYETRAKQTKNDIKKQHYLKMAADIRRGIKTRDEEPVTEAHLEEDDIIMIPGQGQRLKPGFHQHDPDKAEHEGETLKNSLHTIIRVATHLNRELSTRDNFPEWVSEKIGAVKSNIVNVMDYLISQKEMQDDPDAIGEIMGGVIAGGIAGESRVGNRMSDIQIGSPKIVHYKGKAVGEVGLDHEPSPGQGPYYFKHYLSGKDFSGYDSKQEALADLKHLVQQMNEGAKVDRMVKHIEKSEREAGKSSEEAETIAWKTANKRGYLDNKNKKKH